MADAADAERNPLRRRLAASQRDDRCRRRFGSGSAASGGESKSGDQSDKQCGADQRRLCHIRSLHLHLEIGAVMPAAGRAGAMPAPPKRISKPTVATSSVSNCAHEVGADGGGCDRPRSDAATPPGNDCHEEHNDTPGFHALTSDMRGAAGIRPQPPNDARPCVVVHAGFQHPKVKTWLMTGIQTKLIIRSPNGPSGGTALLAIMWGSRPMRAVISVAQSRGVRTRRRRPASHIAAVIHGVSG